jgi:hypothetical protein
MFETDDDKDDQISSRAGGETPFDRYQPTESDTGLSDEEDLHPLDSPANEELHGMLMGSFRHEMDRQYENRIQQSVDEDFYDHIQWTEEDKTALEERGQKAIVYNVIATTCNWVIGTEKRGRNDFKVLPREEEDSKPAEHKSKLLKYLSDTNKTQFNRSRAFEDTVKVGIGWLEDGYTEDDDGEPIYSRYESWRNMLWDSASCEMDLSDCRYLFKYRWIDQDIMESIFNDRMDVIQRSAEDGPVFQFDNSLSDEVMDQKEVELESAYSIGRSDNDFIKRRRVRTYECWFTKPANVERIKSGKFKGEIFDKSSPAHVEYFNEQQAAGKNPVIVRKMMRMHVAIFVSKGLLWVGESPYRHNKYPFTPIWGYRRGRDHLPYGLIRGLRDIQEDINKRFSKALYILSTNKVVMDEGAVDDVEKLREEVARPDSIIEKKRGYSLDLEHDRELSQYQLDLMMKNIQMIQQVGGVTDEMMGRTTNAVSGAAIEARQAQGTMTTNNFFDNLRYAFNAQGEKQLSMIEQFMTEEKSFRITNERGTPEFVKVNDESLPESDIIRTKADFIISESDWRATMRQAQADQLMEMMTRMPPAVSLVMLDLVVELMDVPNREELVGRIRQINGQSDPDADPNSPEEQQKKAAQQASAQMQQAVIEAELRDKLSSAGLNEAKIAEIAAKISNSNVEAVNKAIEAAIKTAGDPAIAVTADAILDESKSQPQQQQQQQQPAALPAPEAQTELPEVTQ